MPLHRVTFFLPVNTPGERRAAADVAAQAREIFGGATVSTLQPPTFKGYWVEQGIVFIDEIALLFSDVDESLMDSKKLKETLDGLKAAAHKAYEDRGSAQLEFWVTTESLQRLSA